MQSSEETTKNIQRSQIENFYTRMLEKSPVAGIKIGESSNPPLSKDPVSTEQKADILEIPVVGSPSSSVSTSATEHTASSPAVTTTPYELNMNSDEGGRFIELRRKGGQTEKKTHKFHINIDPKDLPKAFGIIAVICAYAGLSGMKAVLAHPKSMTAEEQAKKAGALPVKLTTKKINVKEEQAKKTITIYTTDNTDETKHMTMLLQIKAELEKQHIPCGPLPEMDGRLQPVSNVSIELVSYRSNDAARGIYYVPNEDEKFSQYYVCRVGSVNQLDERDQTTLQALVERAPTNILKGFLTNLQDNDLRIIADNQKTLLHHAAARKDTEILQLLLDRKVINIDAKDNNGNSAILIAAKRGNSEAVMQLLKRGADVKAEEQGQGLLHFAMSNFNKSVVKKLIKAGLSYTQPDREGKIPLHYAVENNSLEAVRFLLAQDKKQSAVSSPQEPSKSGPVLSIVTVSQIHQRDSKGREVLHYLSLPSDKTVINPSMVDLLIKNGAHIEAKDRKGNTPLHYAAANNAKAIPLLLNAGADMNCRNSRGITPLHSAVLADNTQSIESLVASNANINAPGKHQRYPLHLAVKFNKNKALETLLKLNANLECRDAKGRTPLEYAIRQKKYTAFELLVQAKKKDPSFSIDELLHQLIAKKNIRMIEFLLHNGANVNSVNSRGETPLHLAAQLGDADVVRSLLNLGANRDLKDGKGKTPFDYASKDDEPDEAVMKELMSQKEDPKKPQQKTGPLTSLKLPILEDSPGGQTDSSTNPLKK